MKRFLALFLSVWLFAFQALAVCTWGSVNSNISLSNGNLTWTDTAGANSSGIGTTSYLGGTGVTNSTYHLYFEATVNGVGSGHGPGIGVGSTAQVLSGFLGAGSGSTFGIGLYSDGTVLYLNGSDGTLFSFGTSAVIGVAVDFQHQKVWWTKNGTTWNNDIITNQNPATNTGGTAAGSGPFGTSGAYNSVVPAFGSFSTTDSMTANFIGPFSYTLPSGFSAWCVALPSGTFFRVTP